ncbi:MAG: radical SAM protein [bacterium]|nr:radical SAM protein [bacterium]
MNKKITSFKKLDRIERKILLHKSKVEYADYAINHVMGCSHGCIYPCYAMAMAKRFGIIKDCGDWLKPKIVENAMELLEKEIPKLKNKIKAVYLSFATDPFMVNQPEVEELTLKIIERLNKDNIHCVVLTKGILPESLINKEKFGKDNEYGITLVSLDEKFRQKFEPGAAPFQERLKALKYLHNQGLKTWVSMEPYPTPNMVEQDIDKILKSIKFVDKIIFGRINYNAETNKYLKVNGNYYKNLAEIVGIFCHKNNIQCIIKDKTI